MSLLGALLIGLLAVSCAFVLGMRARSPRLLDAVRRFNRAFSNPRQMRSAGTPGAYASVIRHTGRSSGKPYETPVGAVATEDGFASGSGGSSRDVPRSSAWPYGEPDGLRDGRR
jgi:hypothetical protein